MARLHLYVIFILMNNILSDDTSFNLNSTKILNEETYDLAQIENFKCEDPLVQCSGLGICNTDMDDCLCFDGYSTVFNFDDFFSNKQRCNYKLKKQIYAIGIALFLSFGFVHFYLENYTVGVFQMLTFLLIFSYSIYVIVKLSLKHTKNVTNNEFKKSLTSIVLICFLSLIFLFWYTFDIFMILFNSYRDSNNVEMQPMHKGIV